MAIAEGLALLMIKKGFEYLMRPQACSVCGGQSEISTGCCDQRLCSKCVRRHVKEKYYGYRFKCPQCGEKTKVRV